MKNKNLAVSAALLVLIVAAIMVGKMLSQKSADSKNNNFVPNFSEAACGGFTVTGAGKSVSIMKKNGSWVVTGNQVVQGSAPGVDSAFQPEAQPTRDYPADSAAVHTALGKLTAMEKGDLISQNPEKQAQLEVDSTKGRLVTVYNASGKTLATFFIGKSGPDWNSNYVREKGSNEVYTVAGSIKYAFFNDNNRWRDKVLTQFDKTQVQTIALNKKGIKPLVLKEVPADSNGVASWEIAGQPAKQSAVDAVLGTLSNLRATDYEDSSFTDDIMGFAAPNLTITVTLRDGNEQSLVLGVEKATSGKLWVRSSKKPDFTLLVHKSTVEKLDKTAADFVAETTAKAK